MAVKKKYYVIWEGLETGIFSSWKDCNAKIKGYSGAKYAGFPTLAEAEYAFDMGYQAYRTHKESTKIGTPLSPMVAPDIPSGSWAVDAACSGNPGKMEYRGVYIDDRTELFHQGPFLQGTNNIGEFLAIVHALALLEKKKDQKTRIYSDSRIAMGWIKNGKAKTKLPNNEHTNILFQLISRAEKWLHTHAHRNPIIKWETKLWGEIPADFGRK